MNEKYSLFQYLNNRYAGILNAFLEVIFTARQRSYGKVMFSHASVTDTWAWDTRRYGWQAGRMHPTGMLPTGMLSCQNCVRTECLEKTDDLLPLVEKYRLQYLPVYRQFLACRSNILYIWHRKQHKLFSLINKYYKYQIPAILYFSTNFS